MPTETGRPGPGSISWQIAAERLAILGWGRAILMQLAHPLVAAGVAQHGTFDSSRRAPFLRLHGTVQTMLDLTFGPEERASAAAARVNRIHDDVSGELGSATGRWAATTRYSAHDPRLLAWVHTTLVDSTILVYERLVRPLSPEEADTYCRDARHVSARLGLDVEALPSSAAALREHVQTRLASGEIAVGADARHLAAGILTPPFRIAYWPAYRLHALLTVGLLPPSLRQEYGLEWRDRDERALDRWCARARMLRSFLPRSLATWAPARRLNGPPKNAARM
jgi:uncharacterized protein (DUF2236 family)